MDSKSDLRLRFKSQRKTLDIDKISVELCRKIRELEVYKCAKNVMIFYPLKYEINLLDLICDDKNFYLPKVSGDKILVCPYCEDLKKSCFGVLEPCSAPVDADILDLVFVPALAVDGENYRLGYGGGFYDRFLSENPKLYSVVPIAKEFCVADLPHENFDVRVNRIVRS